MQQISKVIKWLNPTKIRALLFRIGRSVKGNLRREALYSNIQFPYRMVTAKRRSLPDFLIIGTQKGGTNSLRHFLSQHPQIHMPFSIKDELHYFDNEFNYRKGEFWYRSHFPLRDTINSGELVGETTPAYLFHPKTPKRIQAALPNAKLICILRNPTERAISHYFMALKNKRERLSIMEAMLAEEVGHGSYKKRGLYLEQIRRYENYLKKNHLLILSSEDFFANPQKILKQVFGFLGIEKTFECRDLSPINVGRNKTPVPREVYEYLDEYFKPHNKRLYSYLSLDFGW